MNKKTLFPIFLKVWTFYEFANAMLSTFFLQQGAELYGFSEWIKNPSIRYIFYQYGVILLAVALFYYIASKNPQKYAMAGWVILVEQLIGIIFTLYALGSQAIGLSQAAIGLSFAVVISAVVWFIKPDVLEENVAPPAGTENQVKLLRLYLLFWAGFEVFNALCCSLFLEQGTALYGTSEWLKDSNAVYAFHQYAIAMLVLAVMYSFIASDIVRYEAFLVVYGVEQLVGILLSVYFAAEKQVSNTLFWSTHISQFITVILVISLQPSRRRIVPKKMPASLEN
jgi:hypothetical protein